MTAVRLSEGTRADVVVRDGGRCRRCDAPGREIHHRRGRGMGGTKINPHGYARLVLMCCSCHEWAERNRTEAYDTGWAVRRSDVRADCEIPMVRPDGTAVWLDDQCRATLQPQLV